jgi:hypothetical protein
MQNCEQYLETKKIISVFQGRDVTLREIVTNCLRHTYKEPFLTSLAHPLRQAYSHLPADLGEVYFEKALSGFCSTAARLRPGSGNKSFETNFISIFRNLYLTDVQQHIRQIKPLAMNPVNEGTTLSGDRLTTAIIEILHQMKQEQQNYITWHYADQFSISQISTITGNSLQIVRAGLWQSAENLRQEFNRYINAPLQKLSEEQYLLIAGYFESGLSPAEESLFTELLYTHDYLHSIFEFEMDVRFGLHKDAILHYVSTTSQKPGQTADEFISHVIKAAESLHNRADKD